MKSNDVCFCLSSYSSLQFTIQVTFMLQNEELQPCPLQLSSYSWTVMFISKATVMHRLSTSQRLVSFPNISARFQQRFNTPIQVFLLGLPVVFMDEINTLFWNFFPFHASSLNILLNIRACAIISLYLLPASFFFFCVCMLFYEHLVTFVLLWSHVKFKSLKLFYKTVNSRR